MQTTDRTANLQMTVGEAAKLMSVSERMIYSARRVQRSGRQDLIDAIELNEMTIHAALTHIDGVKQIDRYAALSRAWNAANEDERGRFLAAIEWSGRP